jgi:hypothetical protein
MPKKAAYPQAQGLTVTGAFIFFGCFWAHFFVPGTQKPGYRCNSSARLRRASGISALSLAR